MAQRTLREAVETAERELIVETLDRLDRNLMAAAVALGIHIVTLWRKCRLYGISGNDA